MLCLQWRNTGLNRTISFWPSSLQRSRACRLHQDCSSDLLYWSTVRIYFVKASILSLPLSTCIMHAHLSALLPNGRCLLGWHIMPEVILAVSRPQGKHCSGGRKSVNSARSSSPTILRPLLLYGAWAPRYPSLAWHMRSWKTVSSSGIYQVSEGTDEVVGKPTRATLREPSILPTIRFFFSFPAREGNLLKMYPSILQWCGKASAKHMETSDFILYLRTPSRKITRECDLHIVFLGRERKREIKIKIKLTAQVTTSFLLEKVQGLIVTLKNRQGELLINMNGQFMLSKL